MAEPNVKRGPAPPQTSLDEARAKSGVGAMGEPAFAKGARVFSRMPKTPEGDGRRAPPRPVRRSLLTGHDLACMCALCQAGGKAGPKAFRSVPAATAAPELDQGDGGKGNAPPDKLPKEEKRPKK